MSMILGVTQKNQHLGNQKGMTNNDNRLFALLSVPLVLLCVSVYMLLPEFILLSQNFMPFPTYLFALPTFIIHLVRIWNVLSHLYPSTVSIKGKTSNSCYASNAKAKQNQKRIYSLIFASGVYKPTVSVQVLEAGSLKI